MENIRSRIEHHDLDTEELANLEQQLTTKAQQPVLSHDDEAAHAPTKYLQKDALQAFLPIIQAAAQVRHDLDLGES